MVVDDKYVALCLRDRPDFLLRLEEFSHQYRLQERPALVLQARPTPGIQGGSLLEDRMAVKRFEAGVQTSNGWWQGFRSRVAETASFRGVASLQAHTNPMWAAEMHRDGHFIAGSWRFPDIDKGGSTVLAIPNFFEQMFVDFFAVVASAVSESLSTARRYEVTATLLNSTKLHYAEDEFMNRLRVTRGPPTMTHVQWPIELAEVGQPSWDTTAKAMGAALQHAFVALNE
jgi:hypothetical protein